MFESNDTFVEDTVKVVESTADKSEMTACIAIAIMLLATSVSISGILQIIAIVVLLVLLVALYIQISNNKNVEYEYDYTNGSLEIAKIINNAKRKSIVTIESTEIKMVAAVGTNESLKYDHVKLKTYDCSAHNQEKKDYILVAHSEAKGDDFKVIFTPSDELLNAMERYNKRDIYR